LLCASFFFSLPILFFLYPSLIALLMRQIHSNAGVVGTHRSRVAPDSTKGVVGTLIKYGHGFAKIGLLLDSEGISKSCVGREMERILNGWFLDIDSGKEISSKRIVGS
jgi:hypothetical protein